MSRRIQITLSVKQHTFLSNESDRSSVSVAELIRRAIDDAYGPTGEKRVSVITHTVGRRAGIPLVD